MKGPLSCGFALAALLAGAAHAADPVDEALQRLRHADRTHAWQARGALRIDIDADGRPDYVFLSQDAHAATVGLVLGRTDRAVSVRSFAIADSTEDSLCAAPASIDSESLDYDPYDTPGSIAGFQRRRNGTGFILGGGECDVFHFFWNADTHALDWWRL